LLIRLILGVVLMFHGSQKLFGWFEGSGMEAFAANIEKMEMPMPVAAAYAAALAELVGGALLLVGFLTRIAAIPVAITMLVAAIKVHGHAFSGQHGGMEYPLTLAVVAAALMFTGAGQFSVDGCMARSDSPPPSDG
jgi:putative oxidoreductase